MSTGTLTDSLRETLAVFDGGREPRTTPEVAERLDLGRRGTYARLERLVECDRLETKKVGANARVWWRPAPRDPDDEYEYGREHEQFETLVDAVEEYAIFTLDPDGYVQTWNSGAERIKGYAAEEIVGEHFSTFYTDEDVEADVPEDNLAAARERGTVEAEGWRVCADGSHFWASVSITAICDDDGNLEGFAKVTRDMTQRREYERRLEAQTARLERQREELASELDEVFERIDDGFYALDEQFRLLYLNDRAREVLSLDESAVGADFRGEVVMTEQFEAALHEAAETQEPVLFEDYYEPVDRWFYNAIYPSESGLSVYFREITDEKRRERELQRYETTVETVWDGVVTLDADERFVMVNEAFCELTGYDRDEVLGEHATFVFDEEIHRKAVELRGTDERDVATLAYDLQTKGGETVPVAARFGPCEFGDGSVGGTGVIRDVSEQKERERALEESERRYRTLVENFPDGAVGLFDEDLRYTAVGGELLAQLGVSADDVVGERIDERYPDDLVEEIEPHFQAALDGERRAIEVEYEGLDLYARVVPVRHPGEVFSGLVVVQDVTERVERERMLRTEQEMNRRLVETSPVGITVVDESGEMHFANDRAEEIFGRTRDEINEMAYDDSRWREIDVDGNPISEDDRPFPEIVETGEPLFDQVSGIVHPDGDVTWISVNGAPLTGEDGEVTDVVFAIEDVTEQFERERELERQREELQALNDIDEVVGEITAAVIDQSTREEIEEIVCERIADSEGYLFAWIGDADAATQTVNLRTEAGVEGYLDGITISIDPDDERSEGPTGRAFRTGEMQTTHDVRRESAHDPWREHVESHGFRSSAAIPIVHEGTVYATLNVYAERPRAFEGQEGDRIARLGEIVGHAIAAADRKRALMSDELVELEFQLQDVFAAVGSPIRTEGTIALDHAIPVADGEFVVHGTATADAIEAVTALVDAVSHWESVTVRSGGDPTAFEIRLTEPPVLAVVSELGGYLDRFVIEDGDCDMTIHLPPAVDVRRVIDAVGDAYPSAEMVRRQQVVRPRNDPQRVQRRLVEDLTDRQRAALDVAYHAGFFEWPREVNGEELAESLGVTPPTFHQHLRRAEKKVFDSLYSASASDTR